jgi:hypothetical protein
MRCFRRRRKMGKKFRGVSVASVVALCSAVLTPSIGNAKPVCIQLVGTYTFQLSGLPKKKPKLLAAKNLDGDRPAVASGSVDHDGNRVIGISEMWSTEGNNPVGTYVVRFPAGAELGAYVVTYSGAVAAQNFNGLANIVDCP